MFGSSSSMFSSLFCSPVRRRNVPSACVRTPDWRSVSTILWIKRSGSGWGLINSPLCTSTDCINSFKDLVDSLLSDGRNSSLALSCPSFCLVIKQQDSNEKKFRDTALTVFLCDSLPPGSSDRGGYLHRRLSACSLTSAGAEIQAKVFRVRSSLPK